MQFPGIFAVFIGVIMIVQWTMLLITRQVPEVNSEPYRILFHIVGEMITAILLIISGAALLFDVSWGTTLFFVGMGMLLYTVIVSPGYYAQKGEWRMVLIFSVILILSILSIAVVIS